MAFEFHRKKPLLYADLFKRSVGKDAENIAISNMEGSSSSSSSSWSSQLSSPWDSSSSGFSTPFYSELESDDGDFIAELSREMAERMLQDEDEDGDEAEGEKDGGEVKKKTAASGSAEKNEWIFLDNTVAIDRRENRIDSGRGASDDRTPQIQVSEVKNQPPARKEGHSVWERTEKAQPSTQRHRRRQMQTQYRGRNGSGMQAVFLGGSGSGNGPLGTGVFLPQLNSDRPEMKKKSGCSIVLMPTRVLQALELHFKQRHPSTTLPLRGGGPAHAHSGPKLDEATISEPHSQLEKELPNGDDMQLPQEWTY